MQRLKNDFAMQAFLYCMAFLLTWFFQWLKFLFIERTDLPPIFPIMFLDAFFAPLQGFWNAFVYLRPRWIQARREKERERQRLEREQEQEQD